MTRVCGSLDDIRLAIVGKHDGLTGLEWRRLQSRESKQIRAMKAALRRKTQWLRVEIVRRDQEAICSAVNAEIAKLLLGNWMTK